MPIREMQVKTTRRFHPTAGGQFRTPTSNAGEEAEQQKHLFTAGGNAT